MNQKFLLVVTNLHQYVKLDQALLRHHLLELDVILSKLEKSWINMYNLLLFDVPQTFIVFLTKDMDEHHMEQNKKGLMMTIQYSWCNLVFILTF